jgi:hypothetical protein
MFGPRRPIKSAEGPARTATTQRNDGPTDHLAHIDDLLPRLPYLNLPIFNGMKFIASTAIVADPDGNHGTRGHIALGRNQQGAPVYIAVMTSGPAIAPGSAGEIIAEGSGLDDVLTQLNDYMSTKASVEGSKIYGRPGETTSIDAAAFEAAFAKHPRMQTQERFDGSRRRT